MARRILIVYNLRAKKGKRFLERFGKLMAKKEKECERCERDVVINFIWLQDLLRFNKRRIKEIIEKNYRYLGIAGGDGTVNIVINFLKDIKLPLLVIPIGTINDLARELGITSEDEALNILLSKEPRVKEIYLNQVKWCQSWKGQEYRRYFINNFSLGFDAEVVRYAERLKRKFSSLSFLPGFCYFIAILRMLFSFKANTEIIIEIENTQGLRRRINGAIMSLIICNNPRYGRYFHLAPNAKMNDGKLSVYIIPKMPKFLFMFLILESLLGHLSNKYIVIEDAQKIKILPKQRDSKGIRNSFKVYAQVDGESIIIRDNIEISLEAKKSFMVV